MNSLNVTADSVTGYINSNDGVMDSLIKAVHMDPHYQEHFNMFCAWTGVEVDREFSRKAIDQAFALFNIVPGWIFDIARQQVPTDHIIIDEDGVNCLTKLWEPNTSELISIPNDIIIADTIPIKDLMLSINFCDGSSADFRVIMFDETTKNKLKKFKIEQKASHDDIGMVITSIPGSKVQVLSFIHQDEDSITMTYPLNLDMGTPVSQRKDIINHSLVALTTMGVILSTWYGIQIALLNPILKTCLRHIRTMGVQQVPSASSSKKRKRKVKYVKYHTITADDINATLTQSMGVDGTRSFTRKTMAWYVIGHYRTYNGKKKFVQGFWKGPLRNVKTAADEAIRQREIAQLDKKEA